MTKNSAEDTLQAILDFKSSDGSRRSEYADYIKRQWSNEDDDLPEVSVCVYGNEVAPGSLNRDTDGVVWWLEIRKAYGGEYLYACTDLTPSTNYPALINAVVSAYEQDVERFYSARTLAVAVKVSSAWAFDMT